MTPEEQQSLWNFIVEEPGELQACRSSSGFNYQIVLFVGIYVSRRRDTLNLSVQGFPFDFIFATSFTLALKWANSRVAVRRSHLWQSSAISKQMSSF